MATYIAPNATVVGDVVLEENVNIWYGAVLRGDCGTIHVGAGTNIQDNSVIHDHTVIGKNCTAWALSYSMAQNWENTASLAQALWSREKWMRPQALCCWATRQKSSRSCPTKPKKNTTPMPPTMWSWQRMPSDDFPLVFGLKIR